ncbi:uncharacterized protein LOC123514179 [Portunus trituberculatus]|uniref:uncharacterized protein LOC123514179 n=1 Tax=Portunus trituberculatus TaxID=210409 RepID=UPI001E1D0EE9|nr:uncharacterized protein LOC123514179 [Portunus trituberculatus]
MEEQRREDRAEFRALLTSLTSSQGAPGAAPTNPQTLGSPGGAQSGSGTHPPVQKAAVTPPPPLSHDVTYQVFREWRRRWEDYATMIDLPSLTLPKQRIQLRMCLTLETQRVLEHTLQVSPTSLKPVDEVLDILQAHIRDSNNEALRRRAFTSCRQARGEPFSEFLVRLKSLAEEFDICKAHHLDCEEAWMKHGILTGVHDEELVTKIVSLDAASTLADVINVCRAHEATRSAASAIRASPTVSAVSTYKQTKKASHKPGVPPRQPSPTHRAPTSCSSCGRRDHGPKGCPATGVTCRGCGKTGHYALMPKCPARQSTCTACNRLGHLEKVCKQTKARRSHEGPPEASCQSPISTRDDPTPPPTVRVEVLHDGHSGGLDFIPDTGADTTVIGPQHLRMLGIDRQALGPPPSLAYYNADGTKMSAALGSLQATLVYGELSCTGWIDVQGSWNTPLLSREHCRALGIVPHDFPAQIFSARGSVASVREATNAPAPRSSVPALPLLSTTSPDAAKEYFLREYQDVLLTKDSTQDAPLKPMSGPPMRIHLRDDAQPFAVHTPRLIPLAYRDAVKAELDSMVARGVIAPVGDVPSYWCHPMVVVPKPGGGVRITTDLSKLNAQVSRPAHPSPTPFAAIRSVDARARYFTTIDALCGYWQIPLHEDDQALTTFITPYGRFKYLRGPMGFAATGDAFCLRGDIALQGVPQCVKVVDDILVYDEDYFTHLRHVNDILARCRAHGITLNAKKFVLAAPSVSFCGYRLSHDGIAADPDKVRAITEFATPATLTDLRSFMGLVNQLASFSPDLAATAAPLRPLLSPKKSFVWTPDHEQAFQRVKMALASPPVLAAFDPALPTTLQTDASRLYGLGYALLQDHGGGQQRLVQCGSRFLTDTETRYATIELEMLAVVWAMGKTKFYLTGLQHFNLVTDHRPLVPILNSYSLDAIENPRLQRLKEKIAPYIFTAVWRPGKELCIPDALSRSPVGYPTQADEVLGTDTGFQVRSIATLRAMESLAPLVPPDVAEAPPGSDLALEELRKVATEDPEYVQLLHFVKNGFPMDRYALPNVLRPYWKLREDLYCDEDLVLYGARVLVPTATSPCLGPPARQPSWCRSHQAPSSVRLACGADTTSAATIRHLVIADRLSGWPVVVSCGADTTSAATIRHFRRLFRDLGVPVRLRTDGGPQFASREFSTFLERWGVRHDTSTPHYPQSNGHAESAVKAVKHFIQKVAPSGNIDCEAFDRGLLELRNTPNQTGRSPAQVLNGGRPGTSCDRRAAARLRDATSRYDAHARPLPPLQQGDVVRIQDPTTQRWDKVGTIMGVGRSRDYLLKMPSGRVWWRNRRFLRPAPPLNASSTMEDATAPLAAPDTVVPRRSPRLQEKASAAAVARVPVDF